VPLSEIAVLFRAGSHSFDLEIELGKHGIPFRKYGGIKFAESAHVKDALAFLRVVSNPSDTLSWFRTLKLLDGVGDATVNQILEHLGVERREFRAAKTKEALFRKLHRFPARAGYKEQLAKLARLLGPRHESKSPGAQLSAVLRFYRPILRARYDDHPRRGRDLEHLQAIAKRYKSRRRAAGGRGARPFGRDAEQRARARRRLRDALDRALGEGPWSGTRCS
jgi:DNA helicase-2/ATP-dependent DNA helicase PcrA